MTDLKLYECAVIWIPTAEMEEEIGAKPKVVVDVTSILAKDENAVKIWASRAIPNEYSEDLDRITILVRPF